MINKIIKLTKFSIMDLYSNNDFLKDRNKKIFFAIVAVLITYVSYSIIDYFYKIKQSENFLQIFLFVMFSITTFQTILICNNIFFDSKDIEPLLSLPIKPLEIFVSKFNTIIAVIYLSEIFYGVIPLALFGIIFHSGIFYYINSLISLIIFPIFVCSIWTSIMLILVKLFKFIKNKDIIQVISLFLILLLILCGFVLSTIFTMNNEQNILIEKIININKFTMIIDPIINLLTLKSVLISFMSILCLLIIAIMILLFIAKTNYYDYLMMHITNVNSKRKGIIDYEKDIKFRSIKRTYIKKEIKGIISNPIFFIQYILLQIIYIIVTVLLIKVLTPMIVDQSGEIMISIEFFGIMLCIIQLLFGLSNIAITSISREGNNAKFMKYIPIEFKKQFEYKKRPQIYINIIASIAVILGFKMIQRSFSILDMGIIFILALLLNNLFTSLVLAADLKNPNLKWDSEAMLIKSNGNQIYQYSVIIVFELIIMYLINVCSGINYYIYLAINAFLLISANIIIKIIINKKINKWFRNIK